MKADLRIDGGEFRQTLQSAEEMTTGRLDTRFSGPDIDPLSQRANYDPQSSALSSAYVSAFNDYARKELHWTPDEAFKPSIGIFRTWNFSHAQPGQTPPIPSGMPANVLPDLANAMKINPTLKVQLNAGYFDLATPFYQGVYEMHHLPMPAKLQSNIEYQFYDSGPHGVREGLIAPRAARQRGGVHPPHQHGRRRAPVPSRRAPRRPRRAWPAAPNGAHFLRRALTTFGSCAMRARTRESCGRPVMSIAILHARELIARIGVRGHAADADFLVRECRAHVAHQPAAVECLDLEIDGKFGARGTPADRQDARRRLHRETGEIQAGLGVNGDASSDGDVTDDRLGRHRLAAAGVGREQVADALDLELGLARRDGPRLDRLVRACGARE